MNRLIALVSVLLLAPSMAWAECTVPPVSTNGVTGFQEAVISVSNLESDIATWRDVGQFEVICRGKAGDDMAAFWGLPKGTEIDEVVLKKHGIDRGTIRLVKINGVKQVQIRSSAMQWDTGGIFDLYMYVDDIHAVFDALRLRGWQFYNDPVTYSLGVSTVTEITARGPDGEALCLMQRDAPPYDEASFGLVSGSHKGFGFPFNAALMSADFAAGEKLFGQILGWTKHLNGESKSVAPGDNPLGIPKNLAQTTGRKYAAFAPNSTDRNGSIQIMTDVGLEGRDFSDRAEPPNLGNLTLRVPVQNLKAFAADFTKKGGVIAVPAHRLELAPYGKIDILAIKAPNGARIEFFAKQ